MHDIRKYEDRLTLERVLNGGSADIENPLLFGGALVLLPSSDRDDLGIPSRTKWKEFLGTTYFRDAIATAGLPLAIDALAIVHFVGEQGGISSLDPELATLSDPIGALQWLDFMVEQDGCRTFLMRQWEVANERPLLPYERLVPILPYVMGGYGEVDNLVAMPLFEIFRKMSSFAEQLAGVPDGVAAELRGWPHGYPALSFKAARSDR